jgi:3-hydroxyisobutyrate dehydrogenase-like beta-hydroxyacid dehydrogenase
MNKTGVVGLGVMGSRMANRLLQSGFEVLVYNRSPGPTHKLASVGATIASGLGQIARDCKIIILSLPSSPEVKEVVLGGLFKDLAEGAIVIDTSTIDPAVSSFLEKKLKTKRCLFLDAPVSGGPEGAEAGTLAIMIGGNPRAFRKHCLFWDALERA